MTTIPTISYTDRDFETIRAALEANVRARFPNTWKDFTESAIGTTLLELTAYVFDVLSYQLDCMVNEMFLPTARDRESIVLLARLVGYKLRPATSASVVVTATLSAEQLYDTVIPAHTEITSINGVPFETLQDQVIAAGRLTGKLTFVQGVTIEDEFESNGSAFQEFKLSTAPLIAGSISVTVDGVEWQEVDSLVYSDSVSQSFSTRVDVDDYGYVKFGDGTSGLIPHNGASIVVRYRVGGGVKGNIPIGDIQSNVVGILAGTNPIQTVDVNLVNQERGSGGEERETIDHARFWIPRSVATNGRAVTQQDFDTLANLFTDPVYGSPAYAKAQLKQRIPELNCVQIFLWGRDSQGRVAPPSSGLKQAVRQYFNNNGPGAVRIITVDVEVEDGKIVYLDMDVTAQPNGLVPEGELRNNILGALEALFISASNQPGTPVRLSRLYTAVQSVNGVANCLVRNVTATYIKTELIGTSNGNMVAFEYTTHYPPRPNTITITAGNLIITDNGDGRLIGDVDPVGVNLVDYRTGWMRFTLKQPIPYGEEVTIQYRYPLTYQRSQTDILPTNGITRKFKGNLEYFPLVPNTVAITDGVQVVSDDGYGRLIGDKDDAAVATVDYDSGAFEFTFKTAPNREAKISASYVQLLKVSSGDIPIDNDQLCVPGNFNIIIV